MPNNIPGVVLPGDLEYKNTLLPIPKSMVYTRHQSRIFFLDILGRAFTGEDAKSMAGDFGGTVTTDYVTPEYLDLKGVKGLVIPSLQMNSKDEKKTIFNWEENDVDDTAAMAGTFTEPVDGGDIPAGTRYVYTVSSTSKMGEGSIVLAIATNQQIRVDEVLTSTTFAGYIAENSFTNDSSNFPGTDTQTNGASISDNAVYQILAPAQAVAGFGIEQPFSRPTQRRNAFQTVAYEFERSGHAEAEDGTNATMSTTLSERKMQLQYMAQSAIDDTIWRSKYGHGVYGTDEAYMMDGIRQNIGTSTAITSFTSGGATTLSLDAFNYIMQTVATKSRPEDLVFLGNATLARTIEKLGRGAGTVFYEPGMTEFGTSFFKLNTFRGPVKFFEMPTNKTTGDTNNIMYILNTKYILPVVRAGRGLKWENGVKKDGTQDSKYDVYRGDISLAVMQKELHYMITGITG